MMRQIESLGRLIELTFDAFGLDITAAKDLAKEKAKELCADPMLLSWFEGKSGKFYPAVECGRRDKPPWIIYAEARGGDITIDINQGEFVFIFLSLT